MGELDLEFIGALPDMLAEAIDIIRSLPTETKKNLPHRELIAEYALELAKVCNEE